MTTVWTLLLIFIGPNQFQVVPAGQFYSQERCNQTGELAFSLSLKGDVRVASHICVKADR
jgi:hypothetical protein